MLFTLSICHHGRQYTAVRCLSRIRQLRIDLSRELHCRIPQLHHGSLGNYNHRSSSSSSNHLPELPPLHNGCKNLGFTLLQDLLQSYIPAVEKWFRTVIAQLSCVDDSNSLSDFFYEPVEVVVANNFKSWMLVWDKKSSHHPIFSPATLHAIEELDSEDEEKEDNA
jgi:hypothetical protein